MSSLKVKISIILLFISISTFIFGDIKNANEAIQELKKGNLRFIENNLINTKYDTQIENTKEMQKPHTVILSCMDSRVPPEIIFDQGIGNIFVIRNAGNVDDLNVLASMEYAVKFAGAKLIVVMGHSNCGAVKGAIGGVESENLTQLLKKIQSNIPDNTPESRLVDETAKNNANSTIKNILSQSKTINEFYTSGKIKIVPAFYDISNGKVSFLDE